MTWIGTEVNNSKQSRQLQKIAFALGYVDEDNEQVIAKDDRRYLFITFGSNKKCSETLIVYPDENVLEGDEIVSNALFVKKLIELKKKHVGLY